MNVPAARTMVDLSRPRSARSMVGLDIEEWRASVGLSKYDAQNALGFRNSNHYNRMCESSLLDPQLELLIRLYEESPCARGWKRFGLQELYLLMYGKDLETFKGTRYEKYAAVDLGTRFCKMFNRSSARQYQWLGSDMQRNESELNANAVIECILAKLYQVDDPKEVLERLAKKVWLLRGEDLDLEYRVPTLSMPPSREKTGRKSKVGGTSAPRAAKAPKVKAEKSKARPKAAPAKKVNAPAVKKVAAKKAAPASKPPASKPAAKKIVKNK